ncbi:MAG: winged helix-turn-helix domain-containing protein [Legionella sp.]
MRPQGDLETYRKKLTPLQQIHFDNWILDRNTHSLIDKESVAIPLSQREYELLVIFLEHHGRILSRDQLMDLLYEKDCDSQYRTIDVLIGSLRKKIELDPRNPQLLLTIRGGGYQFKAKVDVV